VADGLYQLADLYREHGQYAKAEPLYQRALTLQEKRFGKDHPHVADFLDGLTLLYKDQGQYERAAALYQRTLQIREDYLGPDHPAVAITLYNLATLDVALEHWDAAADRIDRGRRLHLRHTGSVLTALSEAEQLTFLRTIEEQRFHASLSLTLRRRQDARLVALSAGWVLNGKALAQQALAEQTRLARDGGDTRLRPLVAELVSIRRRLAALTWQRVGPDQAAGHRRRLEELAQQERALSKRLAQEGGPGASDWPWIELETVRKVLPADAVLIELVRLRVFDFLAKEQQPRWQAPRYAAWVIPAHGQGAVQFLDLGEAAPIDTAVAQLQQALQQAPDVLRTVGEADAERQLRQPLQRLAQHVLHPLLPHIGQAKRWLIGPDAALWLVPWAALPLPDGTYALEKHALSYVVSGRDLVLASPRGRTTRPVVLADPDYDLEPAAADGKPVVANEELTFALRSATQVGPLPRFPRLPGTAAEAEAIGPKLKAYAQSEPAVYLGKEAREEVFKALCRPRVVVLSTHGYFLPGVEEAFDKRDDLRGTRPPEPKVAAAENPLLRCGLILAGANQREQASKAGVEDGVLTGLEIVGTDLRGCELVVLSACETGLGQVRNGEGVAGLRQAFQLAGARSVVATLWQIPDRETAKLMAAFFEQLARGQTKADALREAQREIIRARRQRDGAAHPFFWSAFTLTGQWQ
jgi:CHAT domain-containing protein